MKEKRRDILSNYKSKLLQNLKLITNTIILETKMDFKSENFRKEFV